MKNSDIWIALQKIGVESFHHANSVRTSCEFLKAGALLSRAYVEDKHLAQTPQSSDAVDNAYGIWGDVFLDGVDIH